MQFVCQCVLCTHAKLVDEEMKLREGLVKVLFAQMPNEKGNLSLGQYGRRNVALRTVLAFFRAVRVPLRQA